MNRLDTLPQSVLSRTRIQLVGPFKQSAITSSFSNFWLTLPIFATECAERFNFYGFTALLTLYFQQHLQYAAQQAAANFNFFQALCYCTPLFGSWLADQYFGKYQTILYCSLLYLSGQLILPVSSLLPIESTFTKFLTFFSLFLVALGTGGIKPCVSAFGAEQVEWRHRIRVGYSTATLEHGVSSLRQLSKDFKTHASLQDEDNFVDTLMEQISNGYPNDMNLSTSDSLVTTTYFARFYLFINIGAIAGQLMCPWIQQVVGWSGAFFVSAAVLFLSLVIFLRGMRCTGYIHIQKRTHPRHDVHFSTIQSNHNQENHCTSSREEWHCILRISLLLSPIALFWMCWSQQGATWIQQLSWMEMPRIFKTQLNPAQWTAWNPFSKSIYYQRLHLILSH